MLTQMGTALRLWFGFTLLLGLAYPLGMTALSQWIFPAQANGSLVYQGERMVGSRLIGQSFTAPGYFWSRPSAVGYNGAGSGGSNLGPLNPELQQQIAARVGLLAPTAGDAGGRPLWPVVAGRDAGGSGDRLRQRAGSPSRPGGDLLPGRPGGQGSRLAGRTGGSAGEPAD